MSIQTINIGNRVNDGLGDDLRTAFQKVNANFSELQIGLGITASNISSSGVKIFKQKTGANLEFRTLVEGTNIILNEFENTVEINSPSAFSRFDTDAGTILANTGNLGRIELKGHPSPGSNSNISDIEITTDGMNSVKFKTIIPVTEILSNYDFGFIKGNFTNAIQLLMSAANIDFGTVLMPSTFDIDDGKLDPSSTIYN